MTFFEAEGVRRQKEAWSIGYANRQFEHSCTLCACKGLQIRCESCKINQAHQEALDRIRIVNETKKERFFDVPVPKIGVVTKVYICL